MKNLANLVAVISIGLCVYFLRGSFTRTSILTRVANLAPGSAIVAVREPQKRPRSIRMSKQKQSQVDAELPDLVELLAAAILSGFSLYSAIERISQRASGTVSENLALMLRRLELGSRFDQELSALCDRQPTPGIRELANKLSIALARGTPLASALVALSETLRIKQANVVLAKAGSNETKMLIPLVTLVLPTTVIFAIYPSVQFLNVGFN